MKLVPFLMTCALGAVSCQFKSLDAPDIKTQNELETPAIFAEVVEGPEFGRTSILVTWNVALENEAVLIRRETTSAPNIQPIEKDIVVAQIPASATSYIDSFDFQYLEIFEERSVARNKRPSILEYRVQTKRESAPIDGLTARVSPPISCWFKKSTDLDDISLCDNVKLEAQVKVVIKKAESGAYIKKLFSSEQASLKLQFGGGAEEYVLAPQNLSIGHLQGSLAVVVECGFPTSVPNEAKPVFLAVQSLGKNSSLKASIIPGKDGAKPTLFVAEPVKLSGHFKDAMEENLFGIYNSDSSFYYLDSEGNFRPVGGVKVGSKKLSLQDGTHHEWDAELGSLAFITLESKNLRRIVAVRVDPTKVTQHPQWKPFYGNILRALEINFRIRAAYDVTKPVVSVDTNSGIPFSEPQLAVLQWLQERPDVLQSLKKRSIPSISFTTEKEAVPSYLSEFGLTITSSDSHSFGELKRLVERAANGLSSFPRIESRMVN